MPVGSVGKWLVLGTLVAALGAGGCKEDDGDEGPTDTGTPTVDSGGTDSGPADSGTREAGPADTGVDAAPAVMCGGKTCMTHQASPLLPAFPAGCAKSALDAEVCGLIGTAANAYPEAGFPMFVENNAPGAESVSCGAFLESKIEMPMDAGAGVDAGDSGYPNMQLDIKRSIPLSATMNLEVALIYPGCCTPLGFCSANTSKGTSVSSFGQMPSNGGFGCLDPKILLQAAPAALQQIRCDPTSGMIMAAPADAGTDGGGSDAGSDAGASDAGADGGNS